MSETNENQNEAGPSGIHEHPSRGLTLSETNENTNKAGPSRICGLFDFEITQLKEMFPLCPGDVIDEAGEKYSILEDAIDYVIQRTGINEGDLKHKLNSLNYS